MSFFCRNVEEEAKQIFDNPEEGVPESSNIENSDLLNNKNVELTESQNSEIESQTAECEPYYDSVPAEDSDGEGKLIKNCVF